MKSGKKVLPVLVIGCAISLLSLDALSQAPRRLKRTPTAPLTADGQPTQPPQAKLEKIAIPRDGLVLPDGFRFVPSDTGGGTIYMANNNQGVQLACYCSKGKGSCVAKYNSKTKTVKCTASGGCTKCGAFVQIVQGSAIGGALLKANKLTIAPTATTARLPTGTKPLNPSSQLTQTPKPGRRTKRVPSGTKFVLPTGYTYVPKGSGGVIYVKKLPTTIEFDCDCTKSRPGTKGNCRPTFNSGKNELYCAPVDASCSECDPIIIWDEDDEVSAAKLLKAVAAGASATRTGK